MDAVSKLTKVYFNGIFLVLYCSFVLFFFLGDFANRSWKKHTRKLSKLVPFDSLFCWFFFYYGKYARKYEIIFGETEQQWSSGVEKNDFGRYVCVFCFVSFCKTLWHSLIYILSFKTDSVGRYFIFVTSLFRTFNSRHKDFVQPIFEIEHT